MSIEIHRLQRMRVVSETTYGVDQSSPPTFSNFVDVPFLDGTASLTLGQAMLPVNTAQQYLDQIEEDVLGVKSWSLSFQMHLSPTGTAANASTPAITSPLGVFLKAIMGAQKLGTGSTFVSGSTSATVTVTTSHGSRWLAGAALLAGTEAREVKSISTDTLTVKQLSSSHFGAGVIYNGATYSLIENPAESLQIVVEGTELDDRFVLLGGQGSFSLDIPLAGLPTITFNLSGCSWVTYTGAAMAAASYTAYSPTVVMGSEITVPTCGTTTRVAPDVQSVSIAPNITYAPIKTLGGVQTVLRMRRQRSVPIATAQLGLAYQDQTYFTGRTNRVNYAINLQIGTTAGSTVLVTLPTCQITDVQRAEVEPQLAGQVVSYKARNDSDCDDGSTELERSAFRIHLL